MSKTGRPRVEIEARTFEKLCGLQCTETEIADFFGCGVSTLTRWCKREYGKTFEEIFSEKKARGKISLRRLQWQLAEKSPAMAIFLGKNYLEQRDERDVSLKGNLGVTTLAELMLEDYNGQNTNTESSQVHD